LKKILGRYDGLLFFLGAFWSIGGIGGLVSAIEGFESALRFAFIIQILFFIPIVIVVPFVIVGLYFLGIRFPIRGVMKSSLEYTWTDSHVQIRHRFSGRISTLEFRDIVGIEVIADKHGFGTLFINSTSALQREFSYLFHEISNSPKHANRMLLIDVEDAQGVYMKLSEAVKIDAANRMTVLVVTPTSVD
jgi:hypothetical protein